MTISCDTVFVRLVFFLLCFRLFPFPADVVIVLDGSGTAGKKSKSQVFIFDNDCSFRKIPLIKKKKTE